MQAGSTVDSAQPDDPFEPMRPRLLAVAYRMLGSRADAEDVVQDAWLRWRDVDAATVRSPQAWLMATVTRLAIDRLRAAKVERAAYIGDWLPEPWVEPIEERHPEQLLQQAGDVSVAVLWLLERLGPEERAAYLLRQVFEEDYADIAEMMGRSQASVRQLVHRATERLGRPVRRHDVTQEQHRDVLLRFLDAARSGTRESIRRLLADEVTLVSDGGGRVASVPRLRGADRVTNLYWSTALRLGEAVEYRIARVNGEPGLLRFVHGVLESVQTVVTDGRQIVEVYTLRNPDKLKAVTNGGAGTS
jgi:RNA polymerase sigma-70 factor (ECF subfamily)